MPDDSENQSKFHVGCSGWSYADWVGPFYPKGSKAGDYLRMYSSVFDAVEIDSSFYRIPNQFMVSRWKQNTPDNFLFSPKFPKKVTHELKLENTESTVNFFYRTLAALGDKLGPIVIQFPPSFKFNTGFSSLEKFLTSDLKTGSFRHAIEFRHKSWFREEVYKLLDSNNVSFCWSINQYATTPTQLTSNFIYTRMVGERDITKFDAIQKDRGKQMKEMADSVKATIGSVDDAFVFFNNHFAGFGPESVNEFRRLLGLMEMDLGKTKLPVPQDVSESPPMDHQKSLADF